MQNDTEPSSTGITWVLGIVGAVLMGAIQSDAAGFLIGAVLGVLLAQILHLRALFGTLDDKLQALQRSLELKIRSMQHPVDISPTAEPPAKGAESPVVPTNAPPPRPAVAAAPTPQPQAQPQSQRPAAQAMASSATPAPRIIVQQPSTPSPLDEWLEAFVRWFKGGNPLARIGIVILFFGAAFLAKYAAEHSLFPIELRFVGLALGAIALLIVGWRLRDKRPGYAQLLQGGGVAGLYLTVFAASRLYELLPLGLALAILVVVAIAAGILAVAQNALSLAVIGTAGGFLAPIMVSSGGGNHVALFAYYAVLNLGVFTVAWFRTWRVLNVLGFLFTFSITGLWRAAGYQSHDLYSAEFFLALFFLMYVAVSILNCVRQPPNLKGYVSGSLVFGLPVVAFTLHATLVSKIEYALAWSALGLAVFYLALAWTLWRTRRETFRLLVEAFAALGVIFGSLAVPLAFDTRTTAAMWAVEGNGLLWLGLRQNRRLARAFGVLLQALAGAGFMLGVGHMDPTQPVLNGVCIGAVLLGVAGVLSGYWLFRNREQQASYEVGAEHAFTLWGLGWWLFAGLHEIDHFAPLVLHGAALGFVAVTAVLLALVGRRAHWSWPQTLALYLPSVAALFGLVHAQSLGHPFAQWGAAGWLALLVVYYGQLRAFDTQRLDAAGGGVTVLHAAGYWLLAILIGWECAWQIDQHAAGVWPVLPWGLAPAALLALAGRRRAWPQWPVARFIDTYRTWGAIPLAFAAGAWTLWMDVSNVGDPVWLPYIPLLNPLDVSIALCLAALALWWTSLKEEQRFTITGDQPYAALAVMAALTFLWLNAALIRALHYLVATPVTAHGIMNSTLVQAALSIFWGLLGFAAMTFAARRGLRYVWMTGAALMIVVVAKLFLIDLSSVGTVGRIISFISVGVLLLVTGYVAPLPPKKVMPETDEVSQ
jgi:uncharacterized membrane protein